MSQIVNVAEISLRECIAKAAAAAMTAGELPEARLPDFTVEIPGDRAHGDLAVNVAMVSARAFRKAPRQIADTLVAHMDLDGTYFEKVEVAGPGFINLFLSPAYYADIVRDVCEKKDTYGRSDFGAGKKVMVEFVSANPTGPMHMGNARGGALGDCLAAVLDAAGYDVWREFYINDAGNQIEKFATSLEVRYLQLYKGEQEVPMPEDAYQGDDIKEHAKNFAAENGDRFVEADSEVRRAALVDFALPKNIDKMHRDMDTYRIRYDEWFKESRLHDSGEVREVIDLLTQNGLTYEKDGALWYKNAEVLTEKFRAAGKSDQEIEKLELKDDVLIRANGNPTYFAADIAYHRNKFLRGFDTCIDVWGADHHGHVARMKGAMDAIGMNGENLKVVLIQLVRLMRDGEVVRMSKRTGKAIQLVDLLDEIPADAARFFFILREAGTRMDFDLDLAIEQSSSNPVYYVQYAHARICSIFRKMQEEGVAYMPDAASLEQLSTPEERELIRYISGFSKEIVEAAKEYEPARITRFCMELATLFHKFYNTCRVMGEDAGLTNARLMLCDATRITLRNALTLLKIQAPEVM